MLQIQLGPRRDVRNDPMGRSHIGWEEGITQQQSWEAGRGVWKLKPSRALDQDEVRIINTEGIVVAIGSVEGVRKHGDRFEVLGTLRKDDPRVGRETPMPHRSRNSVAYDD